MMQTSTPRIAFADIRPAELLLSGPQHPCMLVATFHHVIIHTLHPAGLDERKTQRTTPLREQQVVPYGVYMRVYGKEAGSAHCPIHMRHA